MRSEIDFVYPDGSRINSCETLGRGMISVVARHGESSVVKLPALFRIRKDGMEWTSDPRREIANTKAIEHEAQIYKRLRGIDQIATYQGSVLGGILLEYYSRGTLEGLIVGQEKPDLHRRLTWMSDAIHIVHQCHQNCVLILDIALRNFVIDKDERLRIIDFSESELLPLGTDMDKVSAKGLTTRVDMFYLGCVLYSLATWTKYQQECDSEEDWPDPRDLPSTENLPFGFLIQNCWHKRYHSIQQLWHESRSPRSRRKHKMRLKSEQVRH